MSQLGRLATPRVNNAYVDMTVTVTNINWGWNPPPSVPQAHVFHDHVGGIVPGSAGHFAAGMRS